MACTNYPGVSAWSAAAPGPHLPSPTTLQEDAQVTAETAARALSELQASQAALEAEVAAAGRRARVAVEAQMAAQVHRQ